MRSILLVGSMVALAGCVKSDAGRYQATLKGQAGVYILDTQTGRIRECVEHTPQAGDVVDMKAKSQAPTLDCGPAA